MTTTRGPQSHDPRHQAEADLQEKGLRAGSVGLLGGVVLGISSVAPAYALTATIGILVAEASDKMAVVIIAGFLPMFFAAYAYRELNKVAPDCGTSFTWTTKSFGPYVGWIGGWAAILATVIVLSNLAGVAVQFFYQFIGEITGSENISTLWENRLVNVVTCLAFLAIATFVAYRGITTTERVQFILVGFQMVLLVVFAVAALAKSGSSDTGLPFSARQRIPRLRERRECSRRRTGPGPRSRADRHRAAVHAVAAQQRSGVLPRGDSGQGHACSRG
jgi:amino acid transporter